LAEEITRRVKSVEGERLDRDLLGDERSSNDEEQKRRNQTKETHGDDPGWSCA
jgi:hypothetical protein